MIPGKFDYVRPGSLDEAVRALADGGDDAKVIAGGQSLLPLLRLRLAYPELLVDVGGIDDVVMPCTPERVWRAIQTARGGEQASAAEQHAARQSDQTQGNSPQGIDTPDQTGGAA